MTRSGSNSSRPADKVPSTRSHPETVVPVALAIDQAGRINVIAETVGEELAQNPHQVREAGGVCGGYMNQCAQSVDSCCISHHACLPVLHKHRGRPHSSSKLEQLEQRLDDLETLRKYCGSKMDAQLGKGVLDTTHGVVCTKDYETMFVQHSFWTLGMATWSAVM